MNTLGALIGEPQRLRDRVRAHLRREREQSRERSPARRMFDGMLSATHGLAIGAIAAVLGMSPLLSGAAFLIAVLLAARALDRLRTRRMRAALPANPFGNSDPR